MRIPRALLVAEIVVLGMFAPISIDLYLPALGEMVEFFGTTESVLNMTIYMFMFSMALGVLLLGPVSDKYGRRNVLVPSLVLYASMSLCCSFATSVESLILFRVLQAFGAGGGLATSFALVRDCFQGSERSRILAINSAIGVLGPVVSPSVGTVIIEAIDWQATFWIPALVALACLVIGLLIPGDIPSERYSGSIIGSVRSLLPILGNLDFTRLTLMMTTLSLPVLGYVAVSSYIYQDGFGVSRTEYSLYLAAVMIIGVMGMMVLRKVRDRVGNRGILVVFMSLLALTCLLLVTVSGNGPLFFMLAMAPVVIVSSSVRAIGFDILMSQDVGKSGAVSSILNFTTYIFGTLGMVIASMPWDDYIHGVALCAFGVLVLYVVLWSTIRIRGTRLTGF